MRRLLALVLLGFVVWLIPVWLLNGGPLDTPVMSSFSPYPGTGTWQCDGALPRWMLEVQGYDGGGCAEVLPSSAAPPDADWSLVCLGMCVGQTPYPGR